MGKSLGKMYTEEEVLAIMLKALGTNGIKGNMPEAKKDKPRTTTEKLADCNIGKATVEISKFTDKDGKVYISQVKVLETGTKTKGFAVPAEDFKAYVGKLNSVLDKMSK